MLCLANEGNGSLNSRKDAEGIERGSRSDRQSMGTLRVRDFMQALYEGADWQTRRDVWTAQDNNVSEQDFCRPSLRRD